MSIEAMKQALNALYLKGDSAHQIRQINAAIKVLHTAIQQAEAQQPSSKEHLFELWWEAHMPNATQEQAWTAFTAAVASNGVGIAAQQPATGEPTPQDVVDAFEKARAGSDKPAGILRGVRAVMRLLPDLKPAPDPIAPATGEPVAWLHVCRKKPELRELSFSKAWPNLAALGYKARPLVFGDTHPAPSVPENFCKYCGGNDEDPMDHCMDCTRPAPSVPADVVRDAERWRIATLTAETAWKHPDHRTSEESVAFNAYRCAVENGLNFEAAIDAAMLAAK